MKRYARLLALSLLIVAAWSAFAWSAELEKHTKFTLYVGLNEGALSKQVYPTDEAKKIFNEIASRYVEGYTLYEADGFWREGSSIASEHTFVCVIVDADEFAVKALMDEAMAALKQRSILLEVTETQSLFYDGK